MSQAEGNKKNKHWYQDEADTLTNRLPQRQVSSYTYKGGESEAGMPGVVIHLYRVLGTCLASPL